MTDFKPEDNVGTIPVQENTNLIHHDRGVLGDSLPDFGRSLCEEFAGGQSNPTYLLPVDTEIRAPPKPPGELLKSAHA